MALIKSTQLIQTGTAVVAGDQVISDDPSVLASTASAPARLEDVALGHDHAIESEPDRAQGDGTDVESLSHPAEGETLIEFAEGFEPAPEDEPISGGAYFEAFDVERDERLEAARHEAEVAAREATGHLGAPDASLELEEAASTLRAAYPEGDPGFDAALNAVTPFVEQQAARALEAVTIQAANDGRWRELATAEEQIASLVDNFARRVMSDPPPEMVLHSLFSEREEIMAEARLRSARMLQEAEEQAARIVHEAQAEASRVILDVESRRSAILEELRQKGYAEGYQEGRSQADEEGAKIVQEGLDSLDALAGVLRQEVRRNEEKVLRLAVGIAEKILMDEIAQRPEAVLRTLDEALNKVSDLEEVIIKVHPDDLDVIRPHEETFRERLRNVRKVDFQASPKIQRGGVFIETASGSVDAQIRTQLSVIEEAFDAVRSEYAVEPLDMTGGG